MLTPQNTYIALLILIERTPKEMPQPFKRLVAKTFRDHQLPLTTAELLQYS